LCEVESPWIAAPGYAQGTAPDLRNRTRRWHPFACRAPGYAVHSAALGDLSENAEYHFAKEENRHVQRQLAELEAKLKSVSVVDTDNVPEDVVFLGHTVKLQDLDDDSEQLVRLVGEAQTPDPNSDVLPVSVNSPMGEALMKARVGDTVKVKAPRGTMEFKILAIV
jgi:transcription elongation factor GreA